MEKSELLSRLAPCGLDCGRCIRFKGGEIALAAETLKGRLAGFGNAAPRFASMSPALNGYKQFEEVVDMFIAADCPGCRVEPSKCYPACAAKTCHKEKKADFCGECAEFPCKRNEYPEMFARIWEINGKKIKSMGAMGYFEEQLKKPRY
jgi:hypothetical protein